jgi:hypothetical protein
MAASGAKSGLQHETTSLSGVEQLELRIARRAAPGVVDENSVRLQPSMVAAINLCANLSGLVDSEIYGPLGIDKGNWSRMRNGQASFPPEKLEPLMQLCGNHVPLMWLADRAGFELTPKLSTLERQVAALRAELAESRRENEIIKRFVQETHR